MKRDRIIFLAQWLHSEARQPLVIRGARQVGKTWLIRHLAQEEDKELIELNFEKKPDWESLFSSNDPQEIMLNISATFGKTIEPEKSLLFLDEIQAAPKLLAKLRWFAEEMPQLAVIAAGSLLDFALAKHEMSMPVGRIGYMYLEPLSFEEFLEATGHKQLRSFLANYMLSSEVPLALHSQLISLVKEYLIIGGMPAAVASWAAYKNLEQVNQIHFNLLATYRDDFAKYSGRLATARLEDVLTAIPRQLGRNFVFSKANAQVGTSALKQSLNLLSMARVCHRVLATAANGLPLGAEVKEKFFKALLLDCGLISAELGLTLNQLKSTELNLVNNGSLSEQLVGQLLRTLFPPFAPPALYFWQSSGASSNAEIDYVMQHQDQIIPIEVKAGKTGTLKSLHQFMHRKQKKLAVRINSDYPSQTPVQVKLSTKEEVSYQLVSLPFYLIGQLHRLLESMATP